MQCTPEADSTCLMRQIMLPVQEESAGLARAAVRRTLAYWGLGDLTEDAVLLVSELVGNAVCHARHEAGYGGPILVLSLTCAGPALRIEVRDTDPRPPQPREPGSLDESGFGFVIVDTLASSWGVYQAEPGKAVWAELAAA
ncbi:MAG TPA: ATP-binding protein [Streptosporangiaceae bacterium]|jgi:anti-sigma regulatory factor (Ser/Thr protein kinase)|nr:ATP-binding protein [Streptosporangiaceae bacterium]